MADAERDRLLVNVVRIGREELADREFDEIPHKLRAVARSTGRGLPAPLRRTLLNFIETNEDFRASVAVRFDSKEIDDAIAKAFLADPATGQLLIDEQTMSDTVQHLKQELQVAASGRLELEGKLAVARERLEEMRTHNDAQMAEHAAASKRAREGLERRLADAVADVTRYQSDNAALVAELEKLRGTEAALRDRLARRDERVERRREARKGNPTEGPAGSFPSEPIALARMLDDLEKRLHFYRATAASFTNPSSDPTPSDRIVLPAGISPESAEAIDSVLAQTPDFVLVDGYNVAGEVSVSSIGKRDGRDDAIARAEAIKRSSPRSEVIVVFDASESGGRGGFRTRDGVLVEFEPTTTADDAIVEFVQTGTDQCLVITNDRELQHRSTREGCVVVFATALISWTEHLNGRSG